MSRQQHLAKFALLGIPTWALVDGTWAALSMLAERLPAGYKISSYLMLSLTLGNIVPLVLGTNIRGMSTARIGRVIQVILSVGFTAGMLMAFLWDSVVTIDGHKESLALYALFFVVGACSSASNVTHFTFVSQYEGINTTALATGMGIGSMTSGVLAILQGLALSTHGFSITIYYLVLSLLYAPAMYAVTSLINEQHSKQFLISKDERIALRQEVTGLYSERQFLFDNYAVLLMQFFAASLGYGVVPAIVSYACSKFNNASLVLLLATGLASVIDPMFKALTEYVRILTWEGLLAAVFTLSCLATGLLTCASLSPESALYSASGGGAMPIVLYICFGSLFGFTNTSVFRYFKENTPSVCVQHAYRYSGIASQAGAMIGSGLTFALIITETIK